MIGNATVYESGAPLEMAIGVIVVMLLDLLAWVPLTVLVWNKLIVRVFETPKVGYVHALVIFALMRYWF